MPASITSVVDAPRLVSSLAKPTRPEWAVTRRSMPAAAAKCSDTRANAVSGFSLACSPREHRSEGQCETL